KEQLFELWGWMLSILGVPSSDLLNYFIPVVRTEMPVVCKIPKNPGSCSKRITRYYYNQESHQCETFAYSGCGGNANHFHSEEECRNIYYNH
uniref:BPTI/Kunitz inhibitor domain-containing protein n=1 Tax=Salvator merianae TaxID=96440 RepID=A0A8D0BIM6_SALMN